MAWTDPESLDDIPMTDPGREHARMTDEDTARALCQFVVSHVPDLEAITGGDIDKERKLGDMLVAVSTMSANVRTRELQGFLTL